MNKQNTKQNKIKIAGQYTWMYHRRTVGLQAIRRITQRTMGAGFNLLKPCGCLMLPYVTLCTARFNIQKVYFLSPKLTYFVWITEETAIISL